MPVRLSSFWKGTLVGAAAFLVITGIVSAVLFEATKSVPVSVTLTDISVLPEGALEVYPNADLTDPPLAQLEFPYVPIVSNQPVHRAGDRPRVDSEYDQQPELLRAHRGPV